MIYKGTKLDTNLYPKILHDKNIVKVLWMIS